MGDQNDEGSHDEDMRDKNIRFLDDDSSNQNAKKRRGESSGSNTAAANAPSGSAETEGAPAADPAASAPGPGGSEPMDLKEDTGSAAAANAPRGSAKTEGAPAAGPAASVPGPGGAASAESNKTQKFVVTEAKYASMLWLGIINVISNKKTPITQLNNLWQFISSCYKCTRIKNTDSHPLDTSTSTVLLTYEDTEERTNKITNIDIRCDNLNLGAFAAANFIEQTDLYASVRRFRK